MSLGDSRDWAANAVSKAGQAVGELAWGMARIPDATSLASYQARLRGAAILLDEARRDLKRAEDAAEAVRREQAREPAPRAPVTGNPERLL